MKFVRAHISISQSNRFPPDPLRTRHERRNGSSGCPPQPRNSNQENHPILTYSLFFQCQFHSPRSSYHVLYGTPPACNLCEHDARRTIVNAFWGTADQNGIRDEHIQLWTFRANTETIYDTQKHTSQQSSGRLSAKRSRFFIYDSTC